MNFRKLAVLLTVCVALAGVSFGQTALTQTTLSAAVSGASGYSGDGTPSIDTTVILASVTNVSSPSNASNTFGNLYTSTQGGQFATELYIDGELMGVTGFNSTTKVVNVIRGIEGTLASDHASGQMVLLGPPSAFQKFDPKGRCTSTGTLFTPWVNIVNGAQWLCSTITGTWVPGFNNPLYPAAAAVNTAVASAAALLPSGPLFHVTGTTTITSFLIPVGFNATAQGGGQFCYINDSTASTTAGNNIGATITGLANTMVCWSWDATTSKFMPFQ